MSRKPHHLRRHREECVRQLIAAVGRTKHCKIREEKRKTFRSGSQKKVVDLVTYSLERFRLLPLKIYDPPRSIRRRLSNFPFDRLLTGCVPQCREKTWVYCPRHQQICAAHQICKIFVREATAKKMKSGFEEEILRERSVKTTMVPIDNFCKVIGRFSTFFKDTEFITNL